jgi:hypothetical protein
LLRSGLALAGANTWLSGGRTPDMAEDGLLTAEDVSGMDLLATELVVLSACETGLGDVCVGEGVFGLQRAFVLAGAKSLVMSLWSVPDEATRHLMEEFYRRILAGHGRADALRAAQLEVRKEYSDPFFWAAFILQGNPGPLSTKDKPLGDILREQKALAPDQHGPLDARAEDHLKQHGDNAQQSLAALTPTKSVGDELEQIVDPDLRAGLARLSAAPDDEDGAPAVPVAALSGFDSADEDPVPKLKSACENAAMAALLGPAIRKIEFLLEKKGEIEGHLFYQSSDNELLECEFYPPLVTYPFAWEKVHALIEERARNGEWRTTCCAMDGYAFSPQGRFRAIIFELDDAAGSGINLSLIYDIEGTRVRWGPYQIQKRPSRLEFNSKPPSASARCT